MIVLYIASVKWEILNIKGIEIIESLCR